jgi:hypothetical protein
MSHWLGFNVLPFDWRLTPQAEIQLPIDLDDFAQQLHAVYPAGEVNVFNDKTSITVRLEITTAWGDPWMLAQLDQGRNTILDIDAWPKPLAVRIILWYRQYVSLKYPLFLIVSDTGEGIELTKDTSPQDVENVYPSNWIIQEWKEL